ncbi:MAG: hypothetical protein NVS4B11_22650 [Ktedonobacteraceae bacterium]
MNSVLCRVTDTELDECRMQSAMVNVNEATTEESYATAPIAAVRPTSSSEEDLHTLFEAAISGRLLAMREQMDRISGPLPDNQQRRYETDVLPAIEKQPERIQLLHGTWQRIVLFGSLGLMLTMIGFDLMGLLVLYMR